MKRNCELSFYDEIAKIKMPENFEQLKEKIATAYNLLKEDIDTLKLFYSPEESVKLLLSEESFNVLFNEDSNIKRNIKIVIEVSEESKLYKTELSKIELPSKEADNFSFEMDNTNGPNESWVIEKPKHIDREKIEKIKQIQQFQKERTEKLLLLEKQKRKIEIKKKPTDLYSLPAHLNESELNRVNEIKELEREMREKQKEKYHLSDFEVEREVKPRQPLLTGICHLDDFTLSKINEIKELEKEVREKQRDKYSIRGMNQSEIEELEEKLKAKEERHARERLEGIAKKRKERAYQLMVEAQENQRSQRDKEIEEAVERAIEKEFSRIRENLISKAVSSVKSEICSKKVPSKPKETCSKSVHRYVSCDGCGTSPIIGTRYKCMTCEDFDFCEDCEEKLHGEHNHPFIKYRNVFY